MAVYDYTGGQLETHFGIECKLLSVLSLMVLSKYSDLVLITKCTITFYSSCLDFH